MLWPVQNDTGRSRYFCGPAAVAALTGTPVSRVEKMIRRVRDDQRRNSMFHSQKTLRRWRAENRKKVIRSTCTAELKTVMERLGCRIEHYPTWGLKTLGQFIDDTQYMDGAFLVDVPGHWVAVSTGHVAETLYGRQQPKWVEKDRRRVHNAWRVFAPATPKEPTGVKRKKGAG